MVNIIKLVNTFILATVYTRIPDFRLIGEAAFNDHPPHNVRHARTLIRGVLSEAWGHALVQVGRCEVPSRRALTVPIIPAATDWPGGVASHDGARKGGLLSANSDIFTLMRPCISPIKYCIRAHERKTKTRARHANVFIGK